MPRLFSWENPLITVFALTVFAASGCGPQSTSRSAIDSQYSADANAKLQDLAPAEGTFSGTMHMTASDQDFDFSVTLKRVMETEKSPQSEDPSETVDVPQLSGNMTFSVLNNLPLQDYAGFQSLINPLGGFSQATFDFGDYDPSSHQMVLPYSVAGYTGGDFGELDGQLSGGVFTGSWFSKPFGNVGTFSLNFVSDGSGP